MSSFPKVMSALMQGFKTVNDSSLQLPVRWPNMKLEPPSTGGYATVDIVPSEPRVATLGQQGEDEHSGFMQVGLYYPLQDGHKAVIAAYEILRVFFVAGRFLTYGDATVTVLRCGMSPPRKQESAFTTFVTVYWRARINRPTVN